MFMAFGLNPFSQGVVRQDFLHVGGTRGKTSLNPFSQGVVRQDVCVCVCLNPFSQGVVRQDRCVNFYLFSIPSLNPFSQGVVRQDSRDGCPFLGLFWS